MLNVLGDKYHIDLQKIEDLIAIQSVGSGDTEQN
jgi:hypothetical protein